MDAIDRSYIVDASVVLAWLLPHEIYKSHANMILELYKKKMLEILAPSILPYEVINGIKSALLRKRITKEIAYEQIYIYKSLHIQLIDQDIKVVLGIAIDQNLSAYDSAYASLIHLKSKPLITADKKLYDNIKKQIKPVIWIEDF